MNAEDFPKLELSVMERRTGTKGCATLRVLGVCSGKRPPSLRSLAAGAEDWEYVRAILESNAVVAVIPSHVGQGE